MCCQCARVYVRVDQSLELDVAFAESLESVVCVELRLAKLYHVHDYVLRFFCRFRVQPRCRAEQFLFESPVFVGQDACLIVPG